MSCISIASKLRKRSCSWAEATQSGLGVLGDGFGVEADTGIATLDLMAFCSQLSSKSREASTRNRVWSRLEQYSGRGSTSYFTLARLIVSRERVKIGPKSVVALVVIVNARSCC